MSVSILGRDGPDATHSISSIVFCVEIPETMAVGTNYTYTYGDISTAGIVSLEDAPILNGGIGVMGPGAASLIEGLWSQHRSTLDLTNRTQIGAFQLAIWELEYDGQNGPSSLAGGNFQVDDATVAEALLAQGWITALGAHWNPTDKLYEGSRAELVALADQRQQDSVVEIPEPVSLVIWTVLGAGAAAMALRRRRAQ